MCPRIRTQMSLVCPYSFTNYLMHASLTYINKKKTYTSLLPLAFPPLYPSISFIKIFAYDLSLSLSLSFSVYLHLSLFSLLSPSHFSPLILLFNSRLLFHSPNDFISLVPPYPKHLISQFPGNLIYPQSLPSPAWWHSLLWEAVLRGEWLIVITHSFIYPIPRPHHSHLNLSQALFGPSGYGRGGGVEAHKVLLCGENERAICLEGDRVYLCYDLYVRV